MTTCADLLNETKRYLYAGQREPLNTLAGAHNSSTTTFTFTYDTSNITAGSYIAVELEIVYVWSVAGSGNTVTVQRGMLGSTAAAHADLSVTTLNPRFPDYSIFQAINADLDDLSAPANGLYQVVETQLTYNPAVSGYDITGSDQITNILRVRYQTPGPSQVWPEIHKYQVKYNQDTSVFPSGNSLTLYQSAWAGLDIRVTYSSPFTPFTALTDNISVAGLTSQMDDIPPLGAAARLVGVRETMRNFTESQGDPRRAQEVPPGAQMGGYRALMDLRQRRIIAESQRLNNSIPVRRAV